MPDITHIDPRVVVPAQTNIHLAGQPPGTSIGSDTVGSPGQQPIEYRLRQDTRYLLITVSGKVQYKTTVDAMSDANGMDDYHTAGPHFGLGDLTERNNTLVGVFLSDERPTPGHEPHGGAFLYPAGPTLPEGQSQPALGRTPPGFQHWCRTLLRAGSPGRNQAFPG